MSGVSNYCHHLYTISLLSSRHLKKELYYVIECIEQHICTKNKHEMSSIDMYACW